jgi:hypothetical protein
MSQIVNRIRFYHYITGVLAAQQKDLLCGICKAYANTVSAVSESLSVLEGEHHGEIAALSPGVAKLLEEARGRIAMITAPGDAVGQKKAGNCKMPEGVCFVKSSKAMLNRL